MTGAISTFALMKVVVLGTSLSASGAWQTPLASALEGCLKHPVTVVTVAKNGATSDWGLAHVDAVVAEKPDVVLIEFASNDASLTRFMLPSHSRSNMEAIIRAVTAASRPPRVFVMSMNPVLGLKAVNRPFLAHFIAVHRRLARQLGAGFVDHRPGWARLGDDELRRSIPDGSHPTAEAAAAVMVPELMRVLSDGRCKV